MKGLENLMARHAQPAMVQDFMQGHFDLVVTNRNPFSVFEWELVGIDKGGNDRLRVGYRWNDTENKWNYLPLAGAPARRRS